MQPNDEETVVTADPGQIVNMNEAGDVPVPERHMATIVQSLAMIAKLISQGDITTRQAKDIRRQLGIKQSYFTRKRKSEKQAKLARKRAARARMVNHRFNIVRGQKKTGRA